MRFRPKCLLHIALFIWLFASAAVHAQSQQESAPPITSDNAAQVATLSYLSRGSVRGLLWSPNGKTLAVPSTLGTWLYNPADFKQAPRLLGKRHDIVALAFSPDSSLLISADSPNPYRVSGTTCFNDTVHIWDVATGQERFTFPANLYNARTIAFSPDGTILAVASSYASEIELWSMNSGQLETTLEQGVGTVFGLAFSPDGSTLVSVGGNEKIFLWDIQRKAVRAVFSTGSSLILAVIYSPDGKRILTHDFDGLFQVRSVSTGELLDTLADDQDNSGLGYSLDGKWLIVGNQLLSVDTDQPVFTLKEPYYTFSPDGRYLVYADDETITLHDLASSHEQPILDGFSGSISSLRFSADGKLVASIDGGNIQIWDFPNATLKQHFAIPDGMAAVAISPDFSIAVSINQSTLYLWDTSSGALRYGLTTQIADTDDRAVGDFLTPVDEAAFTADGKILAFSSQYDRQIRLIDPQTGQVIHTLAKNGEHVTGLAFSADGTKLAALNGNPIYIYDTSSGNTLGDLSVVRDARGPASSLAISSDGQWTAAGDWQRVYLWNAVTGQVVATYPTLVGAVNRLTFSPDGRILAVIVNTYYQNEHQCWGPRYHEVELWDTQLNQRLNILDEHFSFVTALAFSPDGKWLLVGYSDGAIAVLGINPTVSVF